MSLTRVSSQASLIRVSETPAQAIEYLRRYERLFLALRDIFQTGYRPHPPGHTLDPKSDTAIFQKLLILFGKFAAVNRDSGRSQARVPRIYALMSRALPRLNGTSHPCMSRRQLQGLFETSMRGLETHPRVPLDQVCRQKKFDCEKAAKPQLFVDRLLSLIADEIRRLERTQARNALYDSPTLGTKRSSS